VEFVAASLSAANCGDLASLKQILAPDVAYREAAASMGLRLGSLWTRIVRPFRNCGRVPSASSASRSPHRCYLLALPGF